MGISLRGVSGRIDRLVSQMQQSREAELPDVRTMTTEALEAELLANYEATAGRPFTTFASPEEFVDAMRATRDRLRCPDRDGSFARQDEYALEFLKKRQTAQM